MMLRCKDAVLYRANNFQHVISNKNLGNDAFENDFKMNDVKEKEQ